MQKKYNINNNNNNNNHNHNHKKKKYKKCKNKNFIKHESIIMDSIINLNSQINYTNYYFPTNISTISTSNLSNVSTIDSPTKNDDIILKLTEENLNSSSFIPKSYKIKKEFELKKLQFEKELIKNKHIEKELLNIQIKIKGGEIKSFILKSNDNIRDSVYKFLKNNNIEHKIMKGLISLIKKTLFSIFLTQHFNYSQEDIEFLTKLGTEIYKQKD